MTPVLRTLAVAMTALIFSSPGWAQQDLPPMPKGPEIGVTFITDGEAGLAVSDVPEGSAAAEAGLRPGDVIISVNDQPFETAEELTVYLNKHGGERLPIVALRDGEEIMVQYVVPDFSPKTNDSGGRPALGVRFIQGPVVQVIDVVEGSPADRAGIRVGDVIVSMNDRTFASTDAFIDAVAALEAGETVRIDVRRNAELHTFDVSFDPWGTVFETPDTTLSRDAVLRLRPISHIQIDADDLDLDDDGDADVPVAIPGAWPYYAYGWPYYPYGWAAPAWTMTSYYAAYGYYNPYWVAGGWYYPYWTAYGYAYPYWTGSAYAPVAYGYPYYGYVYAAYPYYAYAPTCTSAYYAAPGYAGSLALWPAAVGWKYPVAVPAAAVLDLN